MKTGDTIGKYRLVSRLGRGGMGEVWLATATGYGGFTKTVVLKTLLPELASDPLFVELLAREAKTCSALSHPNLIEVFDFTKQADVYLLAMEHVLGQPLNAIMRAAHARGEGLPAWFALRVAWEVCCGVQYAHELGVIHCDLSPSNVMITYTGQTKVLDFGVAHAAAHGPKSDRLKGKYSYMAPERIKTRATDRRTDIYALGVMLYLVFTGRLPFVGETDAELFHRITHDKLVAPSVHAEVDTWIEQVILRALHPDPTRRYQTMNEVLEALAPCLEGQLGTYGQQHVAAYLATLFGPRPSAEYGPRPLPSVPPPVRAERVPGAVIREDSDEIEIDLETAPHLVPRAPMPVFDTSTPVRIPAPPPAPRGRMPLGSEQIPSLAKPAPPPAVPEPVSELSGKPDKRPLPVFAQASTPLEPKTAVQSLFGDIRGTTSSTAVAGLFARGTRDDLRDDVRAAGHPFATISTAGPDASSDEPPAPAPSWPPPDPQARADREHTRGAFGAYSTRTAASDEAWPWPTSRTKTE
jgi:serine/threonine protein kinase